MPAIGTQKAVGNVGEVLVEGGTTDVCCLQDASHGQMSEAVVCRYVGDRRQEAALGTRGVHSGSPADRHRPEVSCNCTMGIGYRELTDRTSIRLEPGASQVKA